MRLRVFLVAMFLMSCALTACHGGGTGRLTPEPVSTSKSLRHPMDQVAGDGSNPTVCEVLASPDPTGKNPAHYRCYLEPNSTITISGLTLMPYNNGTYWCTPETWAGPHTGGASGPTGLTFTVTGTSGEQACNRVDSASATISTDSTLPDDFDTASYQAQGTFQLCGANYTNCATAQNQAWAYFDFVTGLHIFDNVSNKHIENTSVTHVAGQLIRMHPETPNMGGAYWGPQGCTWTMPSYFPNDGVSAYSVSSTSASPAPSTPVPAGYTGETLWYNTAAESTTQMSLSCDVHTGGPTDVTLTAVAKLGFKTPAPSPGITYGSISINSQYHDGSCGLYFGTWLAYGDPCTGPGIRWRYSTATDADESNGHIAVWQLIHLLNNSGTYSNGNPASGTLKSADCADGSLPYIGQSTGPVGSGSTWTDVDAPAWQLINPANYLTTATASSTFDDYFMYKPPDSPNPGLHDGAIWISLGHIQWAWTAQTSYANPTPAPSVSPDPTHYSAPTISGLRQPTSFDNANINTPRVLAACVIQQQ